MELLKDQMNRIFIVFVSFLIIGMIYLFSYSLSKPEISRINNQTGKDLPEFKNLVDLNQEIFDQEELFKGKVLLNVWASWCITCKVEHPFLKKISEEKLLDTMVNDGLIDAFNNYHMGVTAENVAKKFNITRQEQDEFALKSQKKT